MVKLDESQIAQIVARAQELGPRERATYVRGACGPDTDALERVMRDASLVRAEDDGETSWAVDRSGEVLGPWRLLHRLGGGGMSDVYLAERCDEYHQQVAIKLVRPGLVTRADHNRLKAERQILARLNHRNIAGLLDGGTSDDGIPYLVMEYVDGEPIDVYCERHSLTVIERLALFRGVCAAVHAAHQSLVIHRDLKPSNILVTQDRTLKLLDFGIAKLLGNTHQTRHTLAVTNANVRLFTPGHAAPEQVRGELITTATDVYLLGVLLYELLCGTRPFYLTDLRLAEIERIICHSHPSKPSATLDSRAAQDLPRIQAIARERQTTVSRLRRELAGDLDNIVMMAMRKEPSRRYASVAELAADLKRHDNGAPVVAARDTWRYRTGKFLRRHALGVSAASGFVLLLAVFAVAMAIQTRRVAQSQAIAEQERRRSADVARFLVDLFKISDPSEARGEQMTAREILEHGAKRIQSLQNEPEEQATLMETIGRVHLSLGATAEARPQLEGALVARRKLFRDDNPATASNLSALGSLELAEARFDKSQEYYDSALAMNERLFGADHLAVARALQDLGQLDKMKGDLTGAETALRRSLALFSRLSGPESAAVSSVLNELAQVMERKGALADAEIFYRRAIAIDRVVLGTDHPEVAYNLHNLAIVLQERGNLAAARPLFEQSLAMFRKVSGEKHPDTIEALGNYGRFLQETGDLDGAETIFRQALVLQGEVRGPRHVQVGYDHVNLGNLLVRKGDFAQAEGEFHAALRIYAAALPSGHVYIGSALTGLAQTLVALRKPEEGYDAARRALEIWRKNLPANDPHIAKTQEILAQAQAQAQAQATAAGKLTAATK